MKKQYLEAGKITNTHGIRGEVKIVPWCDSAEFLQNFGVFYIDGAPVRVLSAHVHKGNLLARLEHVSDINEAMRLKGKVICIDRGDAALEDGRYFIDDLIGLAVIDDRTGEQIGEIADVLTPPSNDVYVVKGIRNYMIPAVKEFIMSIDTDARFVRVRVIEGMASDEN